MTISSTSNKAQFNGSGTTGPFAFTFKVFDQGDLTVIKTNTTTLVETTLTITTDYTVSLNADQNNNPGGSVTTIAAVASGYKLTVLREVDALQETDITNGGGFYPEVIENALDRVTMLCQQNAEQLERAALVPIGSTYVPADLTDDLIALAAIEADISAVAAVDSSVTTVAGIAANVTTVAGIAPDVTTVAGISAAVTTVAADGTDIGTVATNIANVNTVAGISGNVTTVAGISANVTSVAGNSANINTVAGNNSNINTVAGISGNVTTVAGISADVSTVAGNASNINTVAGINADVTTVAGISGSVQSVASQSVGWLFDSSTTMADPGAGDLRLNNATPASVTAIAVSDTDTNSADVSAFVVTWDDSTNTNKGTLTIRKGGSTAFAIYTVTGLTDNAGWTQLAVTYVTGTGTFSNADKLFVSFQRAGDKGADGVGAGDVVGPAASTNNAVAIYDGTTGKLLKDGIAPGTSGNVLTSNGSAWTSAAPTGGSGADVPIGAYLLNACGTPDPAKYLQCNGQQVLRSSYPNLTNLPDAMTGTLRSATAQSWTKGAASGTNVVVMYAGTDICTKSSDSGATWGTATIGSSALSWNSVTWMGGSVNKFVATSNAGTNTTHAYSSDGTTWTTATTLTAKNWTDVISNDAGTYCIAVCQNDGTTNVSTNGTSFSAGGALGSASTGAKAIYWMQDAGLFVVFEAATQNYWTSPDGATWTLRTAPGKIPISATAQLTQYVAVTQASLFASFNSSQTVSFFKTTDGITWESITTAATSDFGATGITSIRRFGTSLIAVSGSAGMWYVSKDEGTTWTRWLPLGRDKIYIVLQSTNSGVLISATSFLIAGATAASPSTNQLFTVAIDSTKAQLPSSPLNQYVRYA